MDDKRALLRADRQSIDLESVPRKAAGIIETQWQI